MKNCFVCNEEFNPKSIRQKYCSKQCQMTYWKKEGRKNKSKLPPKEIRQCETCGKDFMPKQNHPRYVYCSNLCASRSSDRKKYIKKWKEDNIEKVREGQKRSNAKKVKRCREDPVYREKINKENRERVAFKKETIPGFREETARKNVEWREKVGLQHFRDYTAEKRKIPGWSEKRQEQTRQSRLKRFEKNPEGEKLKESLRGKEWYSKNKEKRNASIKKYRSTLPPGKTAQWTKNWAIKNRGRINAIGSKYRATKRNAVPSWLTNTHLTQIAVIYDTCPEGFDVDHIVPLQGEDVCGLHVPWNLEHLELQKNRGKGNRMDNEYFKEVYEKSVKRWGFSDGGRVG